jgi:hypothetical protein
LGGSGEADVGRREMMDRIEQMLRVFQVFNEKGLSFTDAMDVLRAFYGESVEGSDRKDE